MLSGDLNLVRIQNYVKRIVILSGLEPRKGKATVRKHIDIPIGQLHSQSLYLIIFVPTRMIRTILVLAGCRNYTFVPPVFCSTLGPGSIA